MDLNELQAQYDRIRKRGIIDPVVSQPQPEPVAEPKAKSSGELMLDVGENIARGAKSTWDAIRGTEEREQLKAEGVDPTGLGPIDRMFVDMHSDDLGQLEALAGMEQFGPQAKVDYSKQGKLIITNKEGKQHVVNAPGLDWGDAGEMIMELPETLGALLPYIRVGKGRIPLTLRRPFAPTNNRFINNAANVAASMAGAGTGAAGEYGAKEALGLNAEGSSLAKEVSTAAIMEGGGQLLGSSINGARWAYQLLKSKELLPVALLKELEASGGEINKELFEKLTTRLEDLGETSYAPRATQLMNSPYLKALEAELYGRQTGEIAVRNPLGIKESVTGQALKTHRQVTEDVAKKLILGSGKKKAGAGAVPNFRNPEPEFDKDMELDAVLDDFFKAGQKHADERLRGAKAALDDSVEVLENFADNFDPNVGTQIRDVVKTRMDEAKQIVDEMYQGLDTIAGKAKFATPSTVEAIENWQKFLENSPTLAFNKRLLSQFEELGKGFKTTKTTPTGGTYEAPRFLTFGELSNSVQDVRQAMRLEYDRNGGSKAYTALKDLERALTKDRDLRMDANSELHIATQAADKAYKEWNNKFNKSVIGRMHGELTTHGQLQPAGIYSAVIGPDATTLQNARTVAPFLKENLEIGAFQNLKNAAINEFSRLESPQAAKTWFSKRQNVLAEFFGPEELKLFENTVNLKRTVKQLKTQQREAADALEGTVFGKVAGSGERQTLKTIMDLPPAEFDALATTLRRKAPQYFEMIKTAKLNNFHRSILEKDDRLGMYTINTRKIQETLDDKAKGAEIIKLYGKQYYDDLKLATEVVHTLRNMTPGALPNLENSRLARLMVFGYLSHKAAIVRGADRLSAMSMEKNVKELLADPERLRQIVKDGLNSQTPMAFRNAMGMGVRSYSTHDTSKPKTEQKTLQSEINRLRAKKRQEKSDPLGTVYGIFD